MNLTTEATYENGMLKLAHPLPLADQQRVYVTIRTEPSRVMRNYGLLAWNGDPAILEYFALSPDLDPGEES